MRAFAAIDGKRLTIQGEEGAILDGSTGLPTTAIGLRNADVTIKGLVITGFRFDVEEDDIYEGHGIFAVDSRVLQDRKLRELGQLVTATGADSLGVDVLAGVLVHAVAITDRMQREEWRTAGAAFFLRGKHAQAGAAKNTARRAAAPRSPQPAAGAAGAG